jgi:hypothetical protein
MLYTTKQQIKQTMELTSSQLINAASVASSCTAVEPTNISSDQVKDMLLGYIAQKSYMLPKHFEQGYATASPLRSTEEVIMSVQSNLRKHLINRASKDENSYHQQALLINKIFENIENLMQLMIANGVTCESNELVVFLIGNLLKSIA